MYSINVWKGLLKHSRCECMRPSSRFLGQYHTAVFNTIRGFIYKNNEVHKHDQKSYTVYQLYRAQPAASWMASEKMVYIRLTSDDLCGVCAVHTSHTSHTMQP
jgi:hypothetical protein